MLFDGRSELDQIDRIFKLLGSPNEKIWPGLSKLPAAGKVRVFSNQSAILICQDNEPVARAQQLCRRCRTCESAFCAAHAGGSEKKTFHCMRPLKLTADSSHKR